MKKTFFNQITLFITKTSIMVGGQAVINGVMMRVPGFYSTAVRNPKNEIIFNRKKHTSIVERYKCNNIPIIRGFLHLVDSMKIGFKTLEWSAEIAEEETPSNKLISFFMTLLSIGFAITLFMGIPYLLAEFGLNQISITSKLSANQFFFNMAAGSLRIFVFLLYLYFISRLKDVRCLFQYHGAEHKVVYNFESGQSIDVKTAQTFSTQHPRCGTSFVFILMLVTIITYAVTDSLVAYLGLISFTIPTRILFHLVLLPLVTGIGYEVLKFLAKKQHNVFFASLSKPGLWLQNITTKEPTDEQVEVSITALKSAFDGDIEEFIGQKFQADAI